ncbi:MAG: type II toxin-antitoxin system RelE/ParE family toxin [Moheibacter sp.]
MDYKIIVSKRAQKEIEDSIEFYLNESSSAPIKFIEKIQSTYNSLKQNPIQRRRYKNVMSIRVDKFPFDLYFVTDEKMKQIRILSCFHQKRNPKRRPRS